MISVLFMGRKKVAACCLAGLLDDERFKVTGVITDSHLERSVTADLARARGITLYDFDSALAAIKQGNLNYDLGISMLYWRKLKDELISHPRLGTINFHPAPLPEYRGVGGYNLAILEGLDKWAASAHYVDASVDTGPIIEIIEFPIDRERETASSLEALSQSKLAELFQNVIQRCASKDALLPTTPNEGGRYLNRRQLEELKEINLETDDVDRKVRAFWFPPYDGAFIQLGGQRYTLTNRQILDNLADPDASSLFSQKAG